MSNPYFILEIPKYSQGEKIRKSYLNLAKKHHPDKSNSTQFQKINEAYKMLSCPKKKAEIDSQFEFCIQVYSETHLCSCGSLILMETGLNYCPNCSLVYKFI